MNFSSTSTLKLIFEISTIDNKSMDIAFNNGGVVESFSDLPDGEFIYETVITFPTEFEITVSGKGPVDTVVDPSGKVIKDKYIKILSIEVDRIPCIPHYVHRNIVLHTVDGQEIVANYWGFNGTVKLDFTEANSFFWALHSVD